MGFFPLSVQNPEMQESHGSPHIFPRLTDILPVPIPVPLPLDNIISQLLTVAMEENVSPKKEESTTSEG